MNCPDESIVNGTLVTRAGDVSSNCPTGSTNQGYYADSAMKGAFPWSTANCGTSPYNTGTTIPPGITSISVNLSLLSRSGITSTTNYDIFMALYYYLPNGPVSGSATFGDGVSSGTVTKQCLDTQVRIEDVGGIDTVNSPDTGTPFNTYYPGDSFGWDQITT